MTQEFKLQNGTILLSTEAPGGIYNSSQLKRIAELSESDSAIIKATEDQRIALFVSPDQAESVAQSLKELGLGIRHYQSGLHQPTTCIGELCPKHEQDALGASMNVSDAFESITLDLPLKIGINGCAQCCVPCHTLDISVVGDSSGYTLSLGGKSSKIAELASFFAEGIPPEELPELLTRVVNLYKDKAENNESLQEVMERCGAVDFIKALAPYSQDAAGLDEAEDLSSLTDDPEEVAESANQQALDPQDGHLDADDETAIEDSLGLDVDLAESDEDSDAESDEDSDAQSDDPSDAKLDTESDAENLQDSEHLNLAEESDRDGGLLEADDSTDLETLPEDVQGEPEVSDDLEVDLGGELDEDQSLNEDAQEHTPDETTLSQQEEELDLDLAGESADSTESLEVDIQGVDSPAETDSENLQDLELSLEGDQQDESVQTDTLDINPQADSEDLDTLELDRDVPIDEGEVNLEDQDIDLGGEHDPETSVEITAEQQGLSQDTLEEEALETPDLTGQPIVATEADQPASNSEELEEDEASELSHDLAAEDEGLDDLGDLQDLGEPEAIEDTPPAEASPSAENGLPVEDPLTAEDRQASEDIAPLPDEGSTDEGSTDEADSTDEDSSEAALGQDDLAALDELDDLEDLEPEPIEEDHAEQPVQVAPKPAEQAAAVEQSEQSVHSNQHEQVKAEAGAAKPQQATAIQIDANGLISCTLPSGMRVSVNPSKLSSQETTVFNLAGKELILRGNPQSNTLTMEIDGVTMDIPQVETDVKGEEAEAHHQSEESEDQNAA